jgi:predicted DNA-binding transcriptional regulator AlpA
VTKAQFLAKWEARVAEYAQLGVSAHAASLCRALLDDLAVVRASEERRVLSLQEASQVCGYSEAHLARLVKQGKLRSLRPLGSRSRLTFLIGDLPR